MLVIYLVVSWFIGLWLASVYAVGLTAVYPPAATALLIAIVSGRWPRLRQISLCLLFLTLGFIRHTLSQPTIDASHIAYYNDSRSLTVTGLVIDEPDVRDRFINLTVAAESVVLADGSRQPVNGRFLLRANRFPVIEYGTRVEVNGRLETPPSNDDFSYKEYLARQGIHSLISLPQLTVLAENQGNPFYAALFRFKARAQTTIHRLIPDPQAALLVGILLGNDNGIPPDLDDAFRLTGLTHIIAISGFNIAILVAILIRLGDMLLPQKTAVFFALTGIISYTLLVGADASVVRAAIMGSTYLLSHRFLGRGSYSVASLFVAGLLMTLLNPFTLWDVGFQLSFAATLSLMLYATPLTRWVEQKLAARLSAGAVKSIMGLMSEAVLITLAAQILTLPLLIAYFEQLSLISLLANALVLPAQPGVMTWGGLATLVGLISPALAQPFAWVAWLLLAYTTTLVRALATVPYAAVPIQLSTTAVLFIYALIGLLTWFAKQEASWRSHTLGQLQKNLTQRVALTGSMAFLALTTAWGSSQPDGQLHVAFLNVGQGDAIFIQTPTGRQVLVDGGFYPSVLNDQLGRQMPFWDREIDLVVATHPDADHVSGLVGVFERYRVGWLLTEGTGLGESPIYDEVLLAAARDETAVYPVHAGEIIHIDDGVDLHILHPGDQRDAESRNENSVSIRLVYGQFSVLLTGDAEGKAEQAMLQSGLPLQSLVFKAGHHGSRTSSSAPFLAAVQPQIVIISAGTGNSFGHPHPETLARITAVGATILRTDELGTIEFISDGSGYRIQAYR